jgi:nucleotide-binding universal stress UspA family protein
LIVAGVSGSPGSVHALRYAADLARQRDATLAPLLAWVPPGGDLADRKNPDSELRQLWKDDARRRLHEAIGTAFGGFPYGVRTWPLALRGPAGPVLVKAASATSDLLVIGAGRTATPLRPASGRVSRYCLRHANCQVLAVSPPALARQASHGLRGWAWRHRGLNPDSASLHSETGLTPAQPGNAVPRLCGPAHRPYEP